MRKASPAGASLTMRDVHQEMHHVDDQQIIRITALVDEASDATINQFVLEPFRHRLAALKPVRPPRFSRFLFIPLDPVIVSAQHWKLGDPAIPRTVLVSISKTLRSNLGGEANVFDRLLARHKADMTLAITLAGDVIWPRGAELLVMVPATVGLASPGLAESVYPPLARSIAAVLRRAPQLRRLARGGRPGVAAADDCSVSAILQGVANETAESRSMITRLILLQAPRAAPALRRFLAASQDRAERTALHNAMAHGIEQVLAGMESTPEFTREIGHASLARAADEVRRLSLVLQQIEDGGGKDLSRLNAIRRDLDQACRTRFAEGVQSGLVAPLAAASGSVDSAGQVRLESCTRDLRTLEMAARKVGDAASYDCLLRQASDVVLTAAQAGTLSSVRKIRLIEILSGPEEAEALYRQAMETR
jgi:hypothetical protein